jgi:hypothetical protein
MAQPFQVDEVFKYLADQYLKMIAKEKSSAATTSGDTTFGDTGAGGRPPPKNKCKFKAAGGDGRIRLDTPSKTRAGSGKKKKSCKDCG